MTPSPLGVAMPITLKKFLTARRLELYERISDLKDLQISGSADDVDMIKLESAESELNLIKSIIEICQNRGRY